MEFGLYAAAAAVCGDHDDGDFVFLVGESSGKASRSLATYTPGPAGMAYAQDASTSAVSDIARAKLVRTLISQLRLGFFS